MPKPVAEVGEGHEDASGNGVYSFIRELIVEGKDARFVNKKGRYVINWSRALKCYHNYKSRRNPQYKSKNINRRKASNGLRAALLNFYKKEGAKEYKDCKKVNEKDEVVERQFQMPPRLFESLFGSNVQLSDDSSEHETSSIASEADEKPLVTPNTSDTGFDEAMDISDDLFNANAEPSSECALNSLPTGDPLCEDITTPCQMFDINFSEEELDSALGEICSNSENDIDLLGVVRDICPSSGSVKGGLQFYISLTEELSEDDQSGIAHFDGIGDVSLERLNCYTLAGIIPASQQPGPVTVTVKTQDGRLLGMTLFLYVDEIQEVLKQLVNDPALQSLYFAMWSKQRGFFGSGGNLTQNLGPFTLQDEGSSIQGTQVQPLKVLQLLVYTAAQTNAQQFIEMIFSTSAGKLIFNSYKGRPQLPEDVARANGHDDLAKYLQDVNARLSKESSSDVQPKAIDWLELIEAVNKIQKQSSVIEDKTDLDSGQSKDDDHQSDYFADAETSSCGSFDLEIEWSDSEDGEGPCSKDGGSDKEPDVKSTPSMNVMPCEASAEVETQPDNDLDLEDDKNYKEPAFVNSKPTLNESPGMFVRQQRTSRKGDVATTMQQEACANKTSKMHSFQQGMNGTEKWESTSDREQEARTHLSPFSKHGESRKEPDEKSFPSVVASAVVVGNDLNQKEDPSLKLSNSYTYGLFERLKNWNGEVAPTSSQERAGVKETGEVRSFSQKNFEIGGGTQKWENTSDREQEAKKKGKTTKPKRHHQSIHCLFYDALFILLLWIYLILLTMYSIVPDIPTERQLLHWAVGNGHIRISGVLMKFVSNVDAPNFRGETPLHVATKNGYKDLAKLLMKHGSNVNAKNYQQQTPLHLAAWSGCQEIADALIRHGSDVKARDDSQQTALHLAVWNRHRNVVQVLVQQGSDVNAENRLGWTPLHLAAAFGYKEIVDVLVQHGSGINIKNNLGYTPLHLAAVNGHLQMVQFLIRGGSDVKARDDKFQLSALHVAAIYGRKQIAKLLIHHGGDVNAGDRFGRTPLHLASRDGHRKVAEVLIQDGSDVHARDTFGQTPLLMAARSGDQEMIEFLLQQGSELKAHDDSQQTPLHLAAQNRHKNIVEVFIRFGSDVNARDVFGQSPLHLASQSGQQEIIEILLQHGSELKALDDSQRTPLHLAAQNGHKNIVEVFIRFGSDVNARDIFGQSPLHLAAQNGHKNIVEVFIRFGSDVNARDIFGQSPLHLAARSGQQEIIEFLIQHESELKAQDDFKQTPLHLAAQNGHKNVAEVLIRYGSDANVKNAFGQTPLHVSVRGGHKQIVEVLLHHGSDVNARDGFRQTPLHVAAGNGHNNIAEALIRYRSDHNARDLFGQTPLHLAVQNGHKNITEVLIRCGSDNSRIKLADTALHLAAWSGYQELMEFINLVTATQTPYYFILRNAPGITCFTCFNIAESGTTLEDLFDEELRHTLHINKTKKLQTSSELLRIHLGIQDCLAPINVAIGLGDDVSGPRDNKLKMDNQSIAQCLRICPSWGDGGNQNINPGLVIRYQGGCETAHKAKRKSLGLSTCILCSTKAATNGRHKDIDGNEGKISHSFGFVDKSIKNGTNKVLIRSELPLKDIDYEGNHLVNLMLSAFLMAMVIYMVLCVGLNYLIAKVTDVFKQKFHLEKDMPYSTKTTNATASDTKWSKIAGILSIYEDGNFREREEAWQINKRKGNHFGTKIDDCSKIVRIISSAEGCGDGNFSKEKVVVQQINGMERNHRERFAKTKVKTAKHIIRETKR